MNFALATACTRRAESAPPLVWPLAVAVALWPHGRWILARWRDGSDDPLGLAAWLVLAMTAWRWRNRVVGPRPVLFPAALGLTVCATLAYFRWPPLAGAFVAALALAASLAAVRPPGQALLPPAGLLVLALPVVSSLQFYTGYPLRLVAAEGSVRLLRLAGFTAERREAAMTVNGHLVLVDAPCSGVQMVWMAYFAALTLALLYGRSDRFLLRRLPGVGVLVLSGNILRNSVLVGLEASGHAASDPLHGAIGLGVLGLVLLAVALLMEEKRHARA